MEQLERLGVATATSVLAYAESILDFVVRLNPFVIRASAELHLELLRNISELHHKFGGVRVFRIEPVRDPHRTHTELCKIVVTGSEARHVIGVVVRQYDQRQVVTGHLRHVLHALFDRADVRSMHTAIDQDMRVGSILSGHRHQKEITEADPVHPYADVALPRGGSQLRRVRRRGFASPRSGFSSTAYRGRGPFCSLASFFGNGFSCGSFASGHDQYSSCNRPSWPG